MAAIPGMNGLCADASEGLFSDPKPTGFLIKTCSSVFRSLFVLARRAVSGYF
jgi:hypothetical protein